MIVSTAPLVPPAVLLDMLPATGRSAAVVAAARQAIQEVLDGVSDRVVIVVGPCSIHDACAAAEYGARLARLASELSSDLIVVMRCYFAKPRTTVGWKGFLNDPDLNGTFKMNDGIRRARELLLGLLEQGLPVGTEFLDAVSPNYISDLISWGAIGARTTEAQTHREMASGLPMPIGFKNSTDGNVRVAVDAVEVAGAPHTFLGVNMSGQTCVVTTSGNKYAHVILRGSGSGTNYDAASVEGVKTKRVMVDCSHGNCQRLYAQQSNVCDDVARQIAAGGRAIMGVMIESFIVEGAQRLDGATPNNNLVYGQSVTDGCVSWDTTVVLLRRLAEAVQARRLL